MSHVVPSKNPVFAFFGETRESHKPGTPWRGWVPSGEFPTQKRTILKETKRITHFVGSSIWRYNTVEIVAHSSRNWEKTEFSLPFLHLLGQVVHSGKTTQTLPKSSFAASTSQPVKRSRSHPKRDFCTWTPETWLVIPRFVRVSLLVRFKRLRWANLEAQIRSASEASVGTAVLPPQEHLAGFAALQSTWLARAQGGQSKREGRNLTPNGMPREVDSRGKPRDSEGFTRPL